MLQAGSPEPKQPEPTGAAQFTRVREGFTCLNCGLEVRGNGYTNHCPRCLWSRHVDINPGDRLADCGGAMRPLAALREPDRIVIVHQCVACQFMRRNKASEADDQTAILGLFGRPVPDVPGRGAAAKIKRKPRKRK
jgi:hypothetical protein